MEEKALNNTPLDIEGVKEKIYLIRGRRVMLDRDLAMLYVVDTKRLNEAVKRNPRRFPDDFMFRLDKEEVEIFSRSQFVTLKTDAELNLKSHFATSSHGGTRKLPCAFTEQGIAMLSSVLNSERAIAVNIQIIRIFTKLREMIDTYKELREKVEEMERHNKANFKEVFEVIKFLIKEKEKPEKRIGFKIEG